MDVGNVFDVFAFFGPLPHGRGSVIFVLIYGDSLQSRDRTQSAEVQDAT